MQEIKEFLSKIEQTDKEQYFRLYKFYRNPQLSLGGSEESTIEKYYEYGDIKYFILNNTFFEFLELCLKEREFEKKLDFNLLRKIRFLLYDSKEFKKMYFEPLEDPYLRDWCNNKVPIGPIYGKRYNMLDLYGISCRYQEHGWIYDLGLPKEQIDSLNTQLIEHLMDVNSLDQEVYYEKYIKPEEDRRSLLNRIKEEDYENYQNCFLYGRDGSDRKVFLHLVCDNEFLQIVEENLLKQPLPKIVIQNIIDILQVGIDFRTLNKIYEDFDYHYQQLGKEKVQSFDYKRAKRLISMLLEKENPKIIKFENYH